MSDEEWIDKATELIAREVALMNQVSQTITAGQAKEIILVSYRRLLKQLEDLDPPRVQ